MDRLKKLAEQTAFQIWLFFLCLILFNWPLLTVIPLDRQGCLFLYIFAAWALVILLLFLSGEEEDGV